MTEKQIRERVSESPQVGTCRAGNLCWFDVHVSNLTDKPFLGTLLVRT